MKFLRAQSYCGFVWLHPASDVAGGDCGERALASTAGVYTGSSTIPAAQNAQPTVPASIVDLRGYARFMPPVHRLTPQPLSRRVSLSAGLWILTSLLACDAETKRAKISSSTGAIPSERLGSPQRSPSLAAPRRTGIQSSARNTAELADLDNLCAALDKDYIDGTLSDYYARTMPRTVWGKALRIAGSASVQPARALEKELKDVDPNGTSAKLPHCHILLEYIDDVE